MRTMRTLILLVLALSLVLSACAQQEPKHERYSMSFFGTFDTVVTIIGFAPSQEVFARETGRAQEQFDYYHKLYDKYHAYDGLVNIHTVNQRAAEAPIVVPQELFDLLKYSMEHYDFTRGQVNIALGAVLQLWHDSREAAESDPANARIPEMAALKTASEHTDLKNVVLNEKDLSVLFLDPQLQLDVGAVAKGYAVERVAQMLLDGPMTSFIINAGGNVRTGHPPLDGRPNWGVAIQDPDGFVLSDANSDILDTLFVSNVSVVTSGDYQRFFEADGIRYHHIISPDTLMPPQHFRSLTIVTKDSGYADLLSTAVFLMEQQDGAAYVNALEGVEALWVMNDRSVIMTDGLKAHAKSQGATNTP